MPAHKLHSELLNNFDTYKSLKFKQYRKSKYKYNRCRPCHWISGINKQHIISDKE